MLEIHNEVLKKDLCSKNHLDEVLPKEIIKRSKLYFYKKDNYLFYEGENIDCLYFFLKGKARVLRNVENGKQALICFYNEFSIFGELEILQKKDALSSVQMITDSYVLKLTIEDYQLLKNHPPFLSFINYYLSMKLMKNNHNTIVNMNYSVEQRLASYMLFMNKDNYFVENHTHLAQYLGCSHRQLLRVINQLCESHILKREKNGIHILDAEKLSNIAGDIYI